MASRMFDLPNEIKQKVITSTVWANNRSQVEEGSQDMVA